MGKGTRDVGKREGKEKGFQKRIEKIKIEHFQMLRGSGAGESREGWKEKGTKKSYDVIIMYCKLALIKKIITFLKTQVFKFVFMLS